MKNFLFVVVIFLVGACSAPEQVEQARPIEVRTVQISKPAPIVPSVDQLRLKPVTWIIITPENVDAKFAEMQSGELVLFALTSEGYEALALNLSDLQALIRQQKEVIIVYKSSYK